MDRDRLVSGLFVFFIGVALVMAKLSGEASAPENALYYGGSGIAIGGIMFLSGLFMPSKQNLPTPAPTIVPQQETKPPVEPTVLVICPNCKARVPSESRFCLECGENLGTDST